MKQRLCVTLHHLSRDTIYPSQVVSSEQLLDAESRKKSNTLSRLSCFMNLLCVVQLTSVSHRDSSLYVSCCLVVGCYVVVNHKISWKSMVIIVVYTGMCLYIKALYNMKEQNNFLDFCAHLIWI